ncbi:P-loop containing nucleoside triphosphate hydrolase protein [Trichoderma velutinum]
MRGSVRWMLLSDLHFKHHDRDRIWQTAKWIVAEAERNKVKRVVICGDLLTSRTMQLTHVLSACYQFIGLLSDVVPRVHILLGNHDLSYRRDYQTTALAALSINRLAPYVSLHSGIAHHEWDGRRVLLLPFREDQDELTDAVAALSPSEASKTVAFAHLAINRAITQRHIVSSGVDKPRAMSSITYRGLTGPDRFASLARTFTGHFHSHQTIRNNVDLQGSITYLGSPLQLSWADLYDERRGAVLFDPETLEHELLINPHAVGYTTANIHQVLDGQMDKAAVADKHVMLVGELSHQKYVTARDRLTSPQLEARSVRKWTPAGFALNADHTSFGGLGASVPESDAAVQLSEKPADNGKSPETTIGGVSDSEADIEPQTAKLDLPAEVRKYVESLELDETSLSRRDELVRVGQRIVQISREMADQDEEAELNHRNFLDPSSQAVGTKTATELAGPSTHVFVAEPRMLTITNFLGVQGNITIDFRKDLPRGLAFLVGENGSGKSTLVEAMVWCQFGRCIRSGLLVDDVVNDNTGKNCSVILEFANGYTIARHRKHKTHGNRVVVSLRGEPQTQLELPDPRTTQEAINELLGIDYETYVRTVVLSHESAASFLSSTPAQRRNLIEASLGLSMLDQCGQVSRSLLRDIDNDMDEVQSKMKGLLMHMEHMERRLADVDRIRKRLQNEKEEACTSLEMALQELATAESRMNRLHSSEENTPFGPQYAEISMLHDQATFEKENLQWLEKSYVQIQKQKPAEPTKWLGQLQRQISQRLRIMADAHPVGLSKLLHATTMFILRLRLMTIRGLLRISGTSSDGSQVTNVQNDSEKAAVNSFREDIKDGTSRLQRLRHEADRIIALEELAIKKAVTIKKQLTQFIQAQKACEEKQQQLTLKEKEVNMYTSLFEDEQSSVHLLRSEHDTLANTHKELDANRELFDFWSSALTKRIPRASSPSTKSKAKASANFRDHVLGKTISELNTLLVQVLTMLYDDTRHARGMATGMLRSLFESDSIVTTMNPSLSSSGPVLNRTLAVNSSLAYGKRSGGERKRVDLALYFALLQLSWARSAHRAHYLLVDEVFDSLDEAGQAAVVRWCGLMSQTVGWVVVITHSRFLVERDLGEDVDKLMVVRAKMGQKGTQLTVDGRKIGVEDES